MNGKKFTTVYCSKFCLIYVFKNARNRNGKELAMTEDFELIQKREGERQRFIDRLKQTIYAREEIFLEGVREESVSKAKSEFYFATTVALISQTVENSPWNFFGLITQAHWLHEFTFWAGQELFPLVRNFTPNKEEQNFLLLTLAEVIMQEIKRPFEDAMTRLAIEPDRTDYLKEIGFTK